MLCKKCGANVLDGMSFCPNCGAQMDMINNNVQGDYNSGLQQYQQPMYNQPPVQQYQQPTYNQQPQMNNNYSYSSGDNFNNNGNKASTGLIIGVIIAVIAAFGVIYYMFNDGGKDKNSNSNSNSNVTSNVESNSNSNIISNVTSNIVSNPTSQVTSNKPSNTTSQVTSNKPSNTTNSGYYSVSHYGYTYQIPKNYTETYRQGNQIVFQKNGTSDLVTLSVADANYATVKSNMSYFKTMFASSGITITKDPTVKYFNGVEFIVCGVNAQGYTMVAGFTKISSSKVLVAIVSKESLLYDITYTAKTVK